MNKKQLDEILAQHKIWLNNNAEGKRADLRFVDLQWADLREADLREADLLGANLQDAYLRKANLREADLQWAKLQWANLQWADLREANLQWADLRKADLRKANLREADLREADLQNVKNARYAILDSEQKQLFGLTTSKDSELEQQAQENVLNKQKIEELEQKIAEQDNTESEKKELEEKLEIAQQKADEKDNIQKELDKLKKRAEKKEVALNTTIENLEKKEVALNTAIENLEKRTVIKDRIGTNIFIGHGQSPFWRELKDFVSDRMKLPWDEFNRVTVAGVTNITRLAQMLDQASIAFLIMTAEDEQADGDHHARMNVIHEVGLFQGRLGFKRAIVLLEDGCQEFSNIQGLGQIRFTKGKISSIFEDVRQVLEREGIVK